MDVITVLLHLSWPVLGIIGAFWSRYLSYVGNRYYRPPLTWGGLIGNIIVGSLIGWFLFIATIVWVVGRYISNTPFYRWLKKPVFRKDS